MTEPDTRPVDPTMPVSQNPQEAPVNQNQPTPPAASPAPAGTLSFDGVEYLIDSLSEEARNQLGNVRATDLEIARLRQQAAIMQTARSAYLQALKAALPKA